MHRDEPDHELEALAAAELSSQELAELAELEAALGGLFQRTAEPPDADRSRRLAARAERAPEAALVRLFDASATPADPMQLTRLAARAADVPERARGAGLSSRLRLVGSGLALAAAIALSVVGLSSIEPAPEAGPPIAAQTPSALQPPSPEPATAEDPLPDLRELERGDANVFASLDDTEDAEFSAAFGLYDATQDAEDDSAEAQAVLAALDDLLAEVP